MHIELSKNDKKETYDVATVCISLCLMKSAKLQRFSPTIAKPLFGTFKHNVELSIFDLAVSLVDSPIAAAQIPQSIFSMEATCCFRL